MADVSKDIISEIRRKILKINLNCYGEIVSEGVIGPNYHPDVMQHTNTYFIGFWQTEKYFKSIEPLLRKELTFKQPLNGKNAEIAEQITTNESVSIHVRQGDYQKARRIALLGNVCSTDYYRRAIDAIYSRVENPTFFIFSDDIDWVKENLKIENACYINFNTGNNSYRDMQLMSFCKHNIIANSTFSWWGAWLNTNPGKIVLAPKIWMRGADLPDLVPETRTQNID